MRKKERNRKENVCKIKRSKNKKNDGTKGTFFCMKEG